MVVDDTIVKMIQTFGTFGVVIWVLWYLLKTMLPGLINGIQSEGITTRETFVTTLALIQKTFSDDSKAQRESFAIEMTKLRSDFALELHSLSDAINRQNLVLVSIAGTSALGKLNSDIQIINEEMKNQAGA